MEYFYSYFNLLIAFTISFSESNSDNKIPLGNLEEKNALKGMPKRSYFSKNKFIFSFGFVQSARIKVTLLSLNCLIMASELIIKPENVIKVISGSNLQWLKSY